ncbi:HAD family hydrolase [Dictyobacter arantiisoli]|uniref:Phosphoglycolate phosphatase n=1 Tax=Dictyobacter arantiisoli TaxID=2014874 RepID=A0A5A5T9T8_9CHLR|nr:HAD family hydrolase [Dictyobacter arantiisoli]GCF08158.1 phosphoglycolate phosphatase [Dictyobacter arantiisoli]
MSNHHPVKGMILDVDGTLVDSNDAHTHAWIDAMQEQGHQVAFETVRPLIGMGGDKVLPEVLHIEKDSEEGQKISERRKEIFKERYYSTVKAFPHTYELLQHIHDQGQKMIIATSAEPEELEKLLVLIGSDTKKFFLAQTTSKDAPQSKPDADIMLAAIKRIQMDASQLVMIGDTAYDIQSATKAGIATIALRCGGWKDTDLQGSVAIYDDPADLLAHYSSSPLGR